MVRLQRCSPIRVAVLLALLAMGGCNTFRETGELDTPSDTANADSAAQDALPDGDAAADIVDTGDGRDLVDLPPGCELASRTPQFTLAPLALYAFDESDGVVVHDCAARFATPHDLTIGGAPAGSSPLFAWLEPGLRLDLDVRVSRADMHLLYEALRDSGGDFSVDVWLHPETATQEGPARILGLEPDAQQTNLLIGAELDALEVRLRTSSTTESGHVDPPTGDPRPALLATGAVSASLMHYALVYDAPDGATPEGTVSLYVDGTLAARDTAWPGRPTNWATTFPLVLGNTNAGDRPWHGTFFRLAIYDRALAESDVAALAASRP